MLATGSAFGKAASIILPFVRAEDPRCHSSVFSISEANVELYGVAPQRMLDLLGAVAGDAPDRSLYGLTKALNKLKEKAPHLMQTKQFQKLTAQARPTSSCALYLLLRRYETPQDTDLVCFRRTTSRSDRMPITR